MAYYSRRHYQRVSPAADTPQQIAERIVRNAVLERVHVELKERFPVLNAANFQEACDWQATRIKELS